MDIRAGCNSFDDRHRGAVRDWMGAGCTGSDKRGKSSLGSERRDNRIQKRLKRHRQRLVVSDRKQPRCCSSFVRNPRELIEHDGSCAIFAARGLFSLAN